MTDEDKQKIKDEAQKLKDWQDQTQDQSILPQIALSDISRDIDLTNFEVKEIKESVYTWWYEQPTNGVSYVRMKVDLKNMSPELKQWVPMFADMFSRMGTQTVKYDAFNDKLMASTTGLTLSLDKYSHSDDLNNVDEQMVFAIGFLDRNIDEAFDCLTQILTTPNFDEPQYI